MTATPQALRSVQHPQPLKYLPGVRVFTDGRVFINELLATAIGIDKGTHINLLYANNKLELIVYNTKRYGFQLRRQSGKLYLQCKPLTNQFFDAMKIMPAYSVCFHVPAEHTLRDEGRDDMRWVYKSVTQL